jgi:hypothetical protein
MKKINIIRHKDLDVVLPMLSYVVEKSRELNRELPQEIEEIRLHYIKYLTLLKLKMQWEINLVS